MMTIPRILSIAGTDPTGGAGIQADLKSIAANRGYGMAVVTALVAQNTRGVRSVFAPPTSFLNEQLYSVSDDVTIDAIKVGMLFNADIIETVRQWCETVRPPCIVIDPVMVATSGDRLLEKNTEARLRELLQLADAITPNITELAALLEVAPATSWDQAVAQGQQVAAEYSTMVVVKGGHLDGAAVRDALVTAEGVEFDVASPRVNTTNSHGTGCSLSSALATNYVRFGSWPRALQESKAWLTRALDASDTLEVGKGNGPVSHFVDYWNLKESNSAEGDHASP